MGKKLRILNIGLINSWVIWINIDYAKMPAFKQDESALF
jgi:hypothetical protein